jgi:hypothetical protein
MDETPKPSHEKLYVNGLYAFEVVHEKKSAKGNGVAEDQDQDHDQAKG